MRVVIATGNPDKVKEFERMLVNYGLPVFSAKELGIRMDVDETGTSFAENALLKCRSIPEDPEEETIVFADDSGLCIDALNGEPGIYSSRYLGEDTPYDVKNAHFIRLLDNVPDEKRSCRYHCAIAVHFPDGEEQVVEATMEGRIAYEPAGSNGFGYDPVFYLPEYGRTCAELSAEEKDRISHRGKAMVLAEEVIAAWLKKHGAEEKHNYTYMLECADGSFYTGWTNDIEKRLKAHNNGTGGKYTHARRPCRLVYIEEFATKQEAQSREAQLKKLTRKKKEELVLHHQLPAEMAALR